MNTWNKASDSAPDRLRGVPMCRAALAPAAHALSTTTQWILLAGLLAAPLPALGQDMGWLLEQTPVVSAVLLKTLDKGPAFSARAVVSVSGTADPMPSTATGRVEYVSGNLRWTVRLRDVESPQLSDTARAAVRQINGEQIQLITRSDHKANHWVLPGAKACLKQTLPTLRLSPAPKSPRATDRIDGRVCTRERLRAVRPDGTTHDVVVWRANDPKDLPVQIQFTTSGETIQVNFQDMTVRTASGPPFPVPAGLSTYTSLEDLVQSVVVEKVKKRIGL